MKLLLLMVACMFLASALPHNEWAQYKAKYGKVYTSDREDLERYNEYLKTKKMVEEHNIRFKNGESTYWMGINHFSDWFPEEINRMLGTKLDLSSTDSQRKPFKLPEGTPVPDSINWVKKGAVTKVKNQGKCGSCYAFSSVGSLEGLMFTTNNTITDLSAQELVDCSFGLGCDGGSPFFCFSYVANRKGIDTDASYPYKATEAECKADKGVIGSSCTGFQLIIYEEDLGKAVGAVGPVSIGFAVDNSFIHYQGGIFDGSCAQNPNHAMVAVGYDKDNKTGKDYWLIKNSWGTGWGEKGYARVSRNVNKCDIGTFSLLPVAFP